MLFLVVCFVIYAVERLRVIPLGRMWEALREDEIACRSLGVNHVFTKLTAFMLGASTGGLAGVFFAAQQGFVNPTSFTSSKSALILAIVVLGGLGSTAGVISAASFSPFFRNCCVIRRIPRSGLRYPDGGDDDLETARLGPHQASGILSELDERRHRHRTVL